MPVPVEAGVPQAPGTLPLVYTMRHPSFGPVSSLPSFFLASLRALGVLQRGVLRGSGSGRDRKSRRQLFPLAPLCLGFLMENNNGITTTYTQGWGEDQGKLGNC